MKITRKHRITALAVCAMLFASALNLGIISFAEVSNIISKHTVLSANPTVSLSDNNFAEQSFKTGFYGNNTLTSEEEMNSSFIPLLYDGELTDAPALGHFHSDAGQCQSDGYDNSITQTASYWQVQISFSGYLKNPQRFVAVARKDGWGMSQHYAVFASENLDDLYTDAKKIIEITDTTGRSGDEVDISSLNLSCKYVGIRFYHRGYTQDNVCSMQFLTEIGMYGGTVVNADTHTTYPNIYYVSYGETSSGSGEWIHNRGYEGKNRLANLPLDNCSAGFYKNNVLCTNEKDPVKDTFFDGIVNSNSTIGCWHSQDQDCSTRDAANDIYQTDTYWQIETVLTKPVNDPEQFVILFHTQGAGLRSQHYAVYASDKKETLYSNKIAEILDTSERIGDSIDLSSRTDLKNITYVAIRFFNRGYNNGGCSIQHIAEIGLYGGTVDVDPNAGTEHISFDDISKISFNGVNRFAGRTAWVGFYKDNVLTYETGKVGDEFFDGSPTSVSVLGEWHTANNKQYCSSAGAANDLKQTSNYWEMKITLCGKLENPEKFDVIFHNSAKGLASKHYAVFVSDKSDNLFNDESKIIEIKDDTGRLGDEVDLTSLGKDLSNIRYVGVRFYHRGYTEGSSGCSMQHLYEIGMFGGTYTGEKTDVRLFNSSNIYSDQQLKNDISAIGKNLIGGHDPYQQRVNGEVIGTDGYWWLTDGTFERHLDIGKYSGQNDGKYDIIYRFDSNPDAIKQIKKFVLRGISNDAMDALQFATGKYEVYASVSYANLFNSENMIYSYDYEKDGSFLGSIVSFSDTIYARYVAIRIINPVTTNTNVGYWYPRISEIAVLGMDAEVPDEETELTKHIPLNVYLTDKNGKKTEITSQFTADGVKGLSDGDKDTKVTFTVNNDKFDLVYNLCKNYGITKVMVDRAGSFGYSIYAAQTFSDLWGDNAKLSSGDFSDGKITARYVRISVDASEGKNLTFKDISIIGMANPLIDRYEHISYSFGTTSISAFEKPINDNNADSIKYTASGYSNLFDGAIGAESLVSGGVSGKSSLNFLINLSQLQSIEDINLYFVPHLVRFQPTKVRIYISDSYEGIMDFTKAAVAEFNGLPENGQYSYNSIPTLARYIRIEFVENNYGKGITDINGDPDEDTFNKEAMHFALTEIDIQGISITGMGDENGVLTSFDDQKSGIRWDVAALDEGDIVDDFYTAKLVETKATNAQKASLYNSGCYKIVGEKVYGIEFYDFFGNKVNNIKSRDVKIKIPVSADKLGSKSLIGDASAKDAVKICETAEITEGETGVYISVPYNSDFKFVLAELTDENDPYWQTVDLTKPEDNKPDGNDSNTDNSGKNNTAYNTNTAGNTSSTGTIKNENTESDGDTEREVREVDAGTERKYSISYTTAPTWLIVITVIQGVLLLAAIALWLIFQFKKSKKKLLMI